jgi:hypothetical protein
MAVRPALFTLVAAGFVWAAPARAEAPAVRNGRAHYLGARFEEAERAFSSVVEDGQSSRPDLVEAFRYLAILRLVQGRMADAREAALRAVSLDRGLQPPEGAPPAARALFDAERRRVPEGGLSCALELPPRPVASAPVGARIVVQGDPGALVASASLDCGGREARATPERGSVGTAVATVAVDGGPAGRRTSCVARLLTASNVTLAQATGTFVARAPVADPGGDPLADPRTTPRAREGGGFPWVWIGVGAGVLVASAIVTAVALSSGEDDATLGPVEVLGE